MERPTFKGKGIPQCLTVDPDIFTPDEEELGPRGALATARQARKVCESCEYRIECLLWACANNEEGIWGATSDNERRSLKRRSIRLRKPIEELVK